MQPERLSTSRMPTVATRRGSVTGSEGGLGHSLDVTEAFGSRPCRHGSPGRHRSRPNPSSTDRIMIGLNFQFFSARLQDRRVHSRKFFHYSNVRDTISSRPVHQVSKLVNRLLYFGKSIHTSMQVAANSNGHADQKKKPFRQANRNFQFHYSVDWYLISEF